MTTHAPTKASPPRTSAATKAPPLDFDARLALAALAVDARIDATPLDLADVIRFPSEAPQPTTPALTPYRTPLAATLHRARIRLETGGWCTGALRDEEGARCPIGAIRIEASSRHQADDACVLLLESIQRTFQTETIPSWNAAQTGPAPVLLAFDRAAELAHARGR